MAYLVNQFFPLIHYILFFANYCDTLEKSEGQPISKNILHCKDFGRGPTIIRTVVQMTCCQSNANYIHNQKVIYHQPVLLHSE